jgi:hypothetical protein
MSQSKRKVKKEKLARISLGEVRAKKHLGSGGIKNFLDYYADALDSSVVLLNATTGEIKMEKEEKKEEPMVVLQ